MSNPDRYSSSPPKTSGKAMASLVLGLLAFCIPCLPALLAVVVGTLGLTDIGRSQGRLTGKGLAITGIVASVLGTIFLAIAGVIGIPLLGGGAFFFLGKTAPESPTHPEESDAFADRFEEAAQRMRAQNNLKTIGLAMHEYQDRNRTLPAAAIFSQDGRPLLSWRVAILPFIETEAGKRGLFQQFHLDEAWDSEHNRQLLNQMPQTYRPVRGQARDESSTYYQVFTGNGTVFEGKKGMTLAQITNADGTSQTLLVVEAGEPVPWTKPEDVVYDSARPIPRLGGQFESGFNVVFADGSVRFLRRTIREKTLRNLITWNDGEAIDRNELD